MMVKGGISVKLLEGEKGQNKMRGHREKTGAEVGVFKDLI